MGLGPGNLPATIGLERRCRSDEGEGFAFELVLYIPGLNRGNQENEGTQDSEKTERTE